MTLLFCSVGLGFAQTSLPVMQATISLDMALEAAQVALASCEAEGYRVSVTVVDASGNEKVLLKSDGAGPHTRASSFGKAFTSASMRSATADIAANTADNAQLDELKSMDERILILAGGLPIMLAGDVIGGIGVGGAPGGNLDAACAQAGLDAVLGN
ncbi:MAG: heme-binding protein [Trueperaceae bacterium]|nr:heme-binding protein [Trueperaceae bacterium]